MNIAVGLICMSTIKVLLARPKTVNTRGYALVFFELLIPDWLTVPRSAGGFTDIHEEIK